MITCMVFRQQLLNSLDLGGGARLTYLGISWNIMGYTMIYLKLAQSIRDAIVQLTINNIISKRNQDTFWPAAKSSKQACCRSACAFPVERVCKTDPKSIRKSLMKKNNSSEVVQIPTQTWTFNHNHRIIQNKKKQVNLKAPRLQDACSSDSLAWRLKFSFRRTIASLPSPKTSRSSELFSTFKAEFGTLSIQCFFAEKTVGC